MYLQTVLIQQTSVFGISPEVYVIVIGQTVYDIIVIIIYYYIFCDIYTCYTVIWILDDVLQDDISVILPCLNSAGRALNQNIVYFCSM